MRLSYFVEATLLRKQTDRPDQQGENERAIPTPCDTTAYYLLISVHCAVQCELNTFASRERRGALFYLPVRVPHVDLSSEERRLREA